MITKARTLGALVAIGLWTCCSAAFAAPPIALTLDAPEAKNVSVSGSFDPWWQKRHPLKKGRDGLWQVVLDLAPGRYEFLFLVDGRWRHDPRLPTVEDGLGGHNNVLLILPQN